MNFYERPDFIPADVVGAPIDCEWKGAQAHIGPVETLDPQLIRLGRATASAQVAMTAGILLWLTWRLKPLTEVDHNLELAEAAFAYTIDWRYLDVDAGPKGKAPDQPPELSAAKKVNSLMRQAVDADSYWNSFFTPVDKTFHSARVTRYILPKPHKVKFGAWLNELSERTYQHFPLPDLPQRDIREFESREACYAYRAPRRGVAIPPQLLDPSFDYQPEQREDLLREFLAGLDRSRNRYLRSPEAMRELGFVGEPYTL
ncbi:MAG: hypothetical protein LWW77_08110 [Propionibacteriales bacterium]|nr:hypothetical protein [Propionibacteriales bacterium]